ncbi:LysR family transcriptional regulator ArgP [Halodesulfovibrio aestuarii]|uniref:LysR family transcriptional regulator, chromosome initiation inhibitor n=1 Tax=Halodesulfovibrio aestuarii TaxID=126333 RepID=A0A8G2C956_9BACT|nr:LysR family transcriptional regulator ArgP [Halodesulfovibrio aestuarii]SHJ04018.1 LysR family transcriptional regulator, chromosome initiation inhibitor [Halodesulfovibrio aestuarii]
MIDYKQLEAFAAVVENGGFEKAATVLHITQSAVSQRIRLLEDRIGAMLIVRSTPVQPTAMGQKLLGHYKQVSLMEQDLFEDTLGKTVEEYITVPVGINADSLATWIPDTLQELLTTTNILVDIRLGDQDKTHDMLKNGEVVGCVSSQPGPMQGCKTVYLGKMIYVCCATPDFAEKWFPDGFIPDAVRKAPILTYDRTDEMNNEMLTRCGIRAGEFPTHYVPDSHMFVDMCKKGLGYGMIPSLQIEEELRSKQLIPIVEKYSVTVRLYWHCWNLQTRHIMMLTDAFEKVAKLHLSR